MGPCLKSLCAHDTVALRGWCYLGHSGFLVLGVLILPSLIGKCVRATGYNCYTIVRPSTVNSVGKEISRLYHAIITVDNDCRVG